ncbi:MAG: DUF2934 domain-containing protein [Verrucomicrobiota bacterium]
MSNEKAEDSSIAALAQRLWEQAGQPAGRDLEFWLQAETVILNAPPNRAPGARGTGERPVPAPAAANFAPSDHPQNDGRNKKQKVQIGAQRSIGSR